MNDRRRQGRIARRGGCRWLGFTFGLRIRWLLERSRGEGRRGREKSPTVRYWRMISCLHSTDPVSSEWEMRAGPIWNNRIPFAIVFLSVSLFLNPTMGTNRGVSVTRMCGMRCAITNTHVYDRAWTVEAEREKSGRVERRRSARRDLRPRSAVHLWQSSHYAFRPSARFNPGLCGPHTLFPPARALCYSFDHRGKRRPPAHAGLWKKFRDCPEMRLRVQIASYPYVCIYVRARTRNLPSIQKRDDVTWARTTKVLLEEEATRSDPWR